MSKAKSQTIGCKVTSCAYNMSGCDASRLSLCAAAIPATPKMRACAEAISAGTESRQTTRRGFAPFSCSEVLCGFPYRKGSTVLGR